MSHLSVTIHQLGQVLSQICDRFSIATDGHLGTRHLPVKFCWMSEMRNRKIKEGIEAIRICRIQLVPGQL